MTYTNVYATFISFFLFLQRKRRKWSPIHAHFLINTSIINAIGSNAQPVSFHRLTFAFLKVQRFFVCFFLLMDDDSWSQGLVRMSHVKCIYK